jgi:uncharacterized membrane protein
MGRAAVTDDRMEQTIGTLLRIGVAAAAVVVAGGGVWYLAANGSAAVAYGRFDGEYRGLREMAQLSAPEKLILAGLLLLVATPVARVVFSLAAFRLERDGVYVAITLAVLGVLLYSLASAWL